MSIAAVLLLMIGTAVAAFGFVELYRAHVVLGFALIVAGCIVGLGGFRAVGRRRR